MGFGQGLLSGALAELKLDRPVGSVSLGVDGRSQSPERSVRSVLVVVAPPCFDDGACFGKVAEEVFVQAFVAKPAVEGLDEGVLHRLARRNVMPFNTGGLAPPEDRMAGQLRAVSGTAV